MIGSEKLRIEVYYDSILGFGRKIQEKQYTRQVMKLQMTYSHILLFVVHC